jgi:hypothetical protein
MLRKRDALLSILLALFLHAGAQQTPAYRFVATVGTPLSSDQEKYLTERMVDADPSTMVYADRERPEIEIRTNNPVDQEQINGLLQQFGAGPIIRWQEVPAMGKMLTLTDIPGAPKYFDTGDQTADQARYQAAKMEWMARERSISEAPLTTPK